MHKQWKIIIRILAKKNLLLGIYEIRNIKTQGHTQLTKKNASAYSKIDRGDLWICEIYWS